MQKEELMNYFETACSLYETNPDEFKQYCREHGQLLIKVCDKFLLAEADEIYNIAAIINDPIVKILNDSQRKKSDESIAEFLQSQRNLLVNSMSQLFAMSKHIQISYKTSTILWNTINELAKEDIVESNVRLDTNNLEQKSDTEENIPNGSHNNSNIVTQEKNLSNLSVTSYQGQPIIKTMSQCGFNNVSNAEYNKSQNMTHEIQSGSNKIQSNPNEIQSSSNEIQSGSNKIQSNPNEIQSGSNKIQSGSNKIQSSPNERQPSPNERQRSPNERHTGPNERQENLDEVTYCTLNPACELCKINHTKFIDTTDNFEYLCNYCLNFCLHCRAVKKLRNENSKKNNYKEQQLKIIIEDIAQEKTTLTPQVPKVIVLSELYSSVQLIPSEDKFFFVHLMCSSDKGSSEFIKEQLIKNLKQMFPSGSYPAKSWCYVVAIDLEKVPTLIGIIRYIKQESKINRNISTKSSHIKNNIKSFNSNKKTPEPYEIFSLTTYHQKRFQTKISDVQNRYHYMSSLDDVVGNTLEELIS
jgi:hypothetical protein